MIIWKEHTQSHQPQATGPTPGWQQQQQQPQVQGQWIKVKEHRVHESSVNSISWAPHELGLALACSSSDGQISIITYRVEDSSWDSKVFPAHQIGCNAVSWCPSPSADYLAALASGTTPAPLTEKRILTGGCDNLAKIWKWDEAQSTWSLESTLDGHSDWVRDVAWAPSGIIATCSQDKSVLIWSKTDSHIWTKNILSSEPFGDTVWRLSWSTAGNLLAVSCGDNTVTLWRQSPDGNQWELVSKTDQSSMS